MRAFTLIELMVVLALLSVMVGTAAISLDGWSDAGRLRSAAEQIAACDALTRTEAIVSGRPRRLTFRIGSSACVVQAPRAVHGRWDWMDDRTIQFGATAVVDSFVTDAGMSDDRTLKDVAVRIHDDGTSPSYAVLFRAGGARAALVVDGVTGAARSVDDTERHSIDLRVLLRSVEP